MEHLKKNMKILGIPKTSEPLKTSEPPMQLEAAGQAK
jgi:hypothetical protein